MNTIKEGGRNAWVLAFLALGVVFGDIGTSPLYALRETFFGHYPLDRTLANVVGALSLFFWSLAVVVTIKYVLLVMRADNDGEGGIFALLGLIRQNETKTPKRLFAVSVGAIIAGAALLYGDAFITPAISVLSAVEGLAVVAPSLGPLVVPIAIVILAGLFSIQRRGTHWVGSLFGPVILLWFFALVVLAIPQLWRHPEVFTALNPFYGLQFLAHHGWKSFWILGAVVLCVTGGEALYAHLGHFGRGAITRAWVFLVYPALTLNYFGQGGRLLEETAIPNNNLFYSLVPAWAMWPMIGLATAATVIASQAMISGSFAVTAQAIALGVFPRLRAVHTNPDVQGQIYVPFINWTLFGGCLAFILHFKTSGALAAAYGIAVTGTMAITTAVFFIVAHYGWKWRLAFIGPVVLLLTAVDLAFFSANMLKFLDGGFVLIAVGLLLFVVMWIWRWGRMVFAKAHHSYTRNRDINWLLHLKSRLEKEGGVLKDGRSRSFVENDRVVVFLASRPVEAPRDLIPVTLRVYLKRHGAMPKHIIMLTVVQDKVPYIRGNRISIQNLGRDVFGVQAHFGFMENPDVVEILRDAKLRKVVGGELHRCTIEIGEEDLVIHKNARILDRFCGRILENLQRLAISAHHYFGLGDVPGISKIVIPVDIDRDGVRIDIPEFAFDPREAVADIDPDTLKESEITYEPLR
ncbi:MAG: KUP/HAK/KT family potassium transporter [bacterium]|nr:KUP/HAK/KT family potassium transporter [bacterium]